MIKQYENDWIWDTTRQKTRKDYPNKPIVPDYSYRILITGGSRSEKNLLLNIFYFYLVQVFTSAFI